MAHSDYKTADRAFSGGERCSECGLDPATIVAAESIGLLAATAPEQLSATPDVTAVLDLRDQLTKAEREVARLKNLLEEVHVDS
jgi:hypothetical protein